MIHPLFTTVLGHPELVADHLSNYAALLKDESASAGRSLTRRLLAGVLAAVSALLALGLIGIAVMLGMLHGAFHWVLVIVPGVAVLIACIAAWVATRPTVAPAFAALREQVDADVQALHAAGGRHGH